MTTMIDILIVDDHPAVCEGIASMLHAVSPEALNVRFALDGYQGLRMLQEDPAHLLILDVEMRKQDGLATLEQLQKLKLPPPVLVMSFRTDYNTIQKMMARGADGYVSKLIGAEELMKGIEEILNGGCYYDNEISRVLLAHSQETLEGIQKSNLSLREIEILKMICSDYTHEQIAFTLNISPRTVEGHAKNLRIKLKARSTAGMVMYAYQNGIVK